MRDVPNGMHGGLGLRLWVSVYGAVLVMREGMRASLPDEHRLQRYDRLVRSVDAELLETGNYRRIRRILFALVP